ncbi:hypothetical protein VII00023_13737 [Vibrio ichthyoenteri ATCC 700023]|uniref:DUF3545 domain-containing protein n=1 Tax=Vibrio ichthyoenteri ATCC 700023 TaxID=870968 RepID=F9RWW1_9VIBR|nr:DUF3545 family protein [Vibrio ichthyoenteri]EGU48875.1 hypothetical protein VII00023_13737 [Vibrio ichthyoenteri ATCC 700023]
MDGLNFDDMMEMDFSRGRSAKSKPVKRKWREIEAIQDRRRLEKELLDMDIGLDKLENLEF